MKKKQPKDSLFIKDWMQLQPYATQTSEDLYFLQLANRMLALLTEIPENEISRSAKRLIALSVTSYFQDVISGFGLWRGFTNKHFSMYGKYLPFYDLTEEYLPDEINFEDVCFIIWSILQNEKQKERETILNPDNPMSQLIGMGLFMLISQEYETAPDNEILKDYFAKTPYYDDLFLFRENLAWLFYQSYFFLPYTEGKLEKQTELLKQHTNDNTKANIDRFAYSAKYELALDTPCGPLALRIHEWLAAIVGEETELGRTILQTELRYGKCRNYYVENQDKDYLTLVPSNSDNRLKVRRDSIGESSLHSLEGETIHCTLIRHKGEWQLNGFMMTIEKGDYQKEKMEFEQRKENAEYTHKMFRAAYPGKTIIYACNAKELDASYKKIFHSVNGTGGPSNLEDLENFIIFEDGENGLTTMEGLALFINEKHNPCYNKHEAEEWGFSIFITHEVPKHIIEYIVKNKLIPDVALNSFKSKERGKELIQENLDFMFRFFQPLGFK